VTVNGAEYNITTFTGSYADNEIKFSPALMPWWGSESLSLNFASALANSLGYPNNWPIWDGLAQNPGRPACELCVAPLFAYRFSNISDWNIWLRFTSNGGDSDLPREQGGVIPTNQSYFTWAALASAPGPVPPDPAPAPGAPGPLPVFGAFAAFGFSRKLRKRIKACTKSASSSYTI